MCDNRNFLRMVLLTLGQSLLAGLLGVAGIGLGVLVVDGKFLSILWGGMVFWAFFGIWSGQSASTDVLLCSGLSSRRRAVLVYAAGFSLTMLLIVVVGLFLEGRLLIHWLLPFVMGVLFSGFHPWGLCFVKEE